MKIIRFTASWCADCIVMRSVWSKWLAGLDKFELIDFDFDDDSEEVAKYQVKRVPLVVVFDDNNQQVAKFEGMQNLDALQKITSK